MASAVREWGSEQGGGVHQQRRSRATLSSSAEPPEADTWQPSPRTPCSDSAHSEPSPEPKEHEQPRPRGFWGAHLFKGVLGTLGWDSQPGGESRKPPSRHRKGPLKSFFESLLALAVSLFILWTFFLCPHHQHHQHHQHQQHQQQLALHGSHVAASAAPGGAPPAASAAAAMARAGAAGGAVGAAGTEGAGAGAGVVAGGAGSVAGGAGAGADAGRSVHEEDVVRALEVLGSEPLPAVHHGTPQGGPLPGKGPLQDKGPLHGKGPLHDKGPLQDRGLQRAVLQRGGGLRQEHSEAHEVMRECHSSAPQEDPADAFTGPSLDVDGTPLGAPGLLTGPSIGPFLRALGWGARGGTGATTPEVHHSLHQSEHRTPWLRHAPCGDDNPGGPTPTLQHRLQSEHAQAAGLHPHDLTELDRANSKKTGLGLLGRQSRDRGEGTERTAEESRGYTGGGPLEPGTDAPDLGRAGGSAGFAKNTYSSEGGDTNSVGEYLRGWMRGPWRRGRGPAVHPASGRRPNRTRISTLRMCDILGEGFFAPSPGLPRHLVRYRGKGRKRCGASSGAPVAMPLANKEGALVGAGVGESTERGAGLGQGTLTKEGAEIDAAKGTGSDTGTGMGTGTEAEAGEGAEGGAKEGRRVREDLICLAIPSVPRGTKEHETAVVAEELIRALSDRRISSVPVHYSFAAVVYSAGCYTPSEEAYTESVLAAHREDLERAARYAGGGGGSGANKSISVSVVGAPRELCDAIASPEGLLQGMPEHQTEGHWLWRTKETIDFTYVIRQCLALGPTYIVFLEDDTWPVKGYDYGIQQVLDSGLKGKVWHAVSLYFPSSNAWRHRHLASNYTFPCCTQAILLPQREARSLVEYVEDHFIAKPVDWLIRDYLKAMGHIGLAHIPSLFQHQISIPSSNRWRHTSARFHKDVAFHDTYVARKYHVKV